MLRSEADFVCMYNNQWNIYATGFSNLILKSVNFEHIIMVLELKGKNTNIKTDLSIIIKINLIITMRQNSNRKCMVNEKDTSNINEIMVFNFYYKIIVSNFVYIVNTWLTFFVGSLQSVVRVGWDFIHNYMQTVSVSWRNFALHHVTEVVSKIIIIIASTHLH